MRNTVGIVVSLNTEKLLHDSVTSIKKWYPFLPIIIIDGSHRHNGCYKEADNLTKAYSDIKCVHYFGNTGHGKGLHYGITQSTEKYILIFDSDIIMKSPCIELMQKRIDMGDAYGIGQIVDVNEKGFNVPDDTGIPYLHPHFALIDRQEYFKHGKIINHGAPMIEIMIDLYHNEKYNYILDFPVEKYVYHIGRGTRTEGMNKVLRNSNMVR